MVRRTIQNKQYIEQTQQFWNSAGPDTMSRNVGKKLRLLTA